MHDNWKTALEKSNIPEHMQGGMERWIEHGVPPGSFLTAVLSNDLRGAFERTDSDNLPLIRDYLVFLYNYAPMGCWGSELAFRQWEKDKLEARERAERGN
jgi:hypothetical protein